jgi:hypothetical protein
MNFRPSSRAELGKTLLELATFAPADASAADALAIECAALARRISEDPALAGPVPEIVWHFLSDVDVRFKDPKYASDQSGALLESLWNWN